MRPPESRIVLHQRQAPATHASQLEHGPVGQQLTPAIRGGRDSVVKQAALLTWWLGVALVCTILACLRSLTCSSKRLLFSTTSIRLGKRRVDISPLVILIMVTTGVITAVSMEWLDRTTNRSSAPGLLRPAYSCGNDCCQIWAACDLHTHLSTLVSDTRHLSPQNSAPGSLYAILDVEPTVQATELRDAARRIAQRVEQRLYSDSTERLVTEVFRAAQFLETERSRRLYDEVFMPVVWSERSLTPGAIISPSPPEAMNAPGQLGPICSAAFGACCDTASDGF